MSARVEKILDRRIRHGKVEYFIKWRGSANIENHWVPESSMRCKKLIESYEQSRQEKENAASTSMSVAPDSTSDVPKRTKTLVPDSSVPNGFDRGLEVEKIVHASRIDGIHYLHVKFQGVEQVERLLSKVVHLKKPQLAIKFYEERLVWTSSDDEA